MQWRSAHSVCRLRTVSQMKPLALRSLETQPSEFRNLCFDSFSFHPKDEETSKIRQIPGKRTWYRERKHTHVHTRCACACEWHRRVYERGEFEYVKVVSAFRYSCVMTYAVASNDEACAHWWAGVKCLFLHSCRYS